MESAVPESSQKYLMKVQVLLAMVQDRLSKGDYIQLLYQWLNVVMLTQEIKHITKKALWVSVDYLGLE